MSCTAYPWSEKSFISGHPVLDFVNTVADQDKSRTLNLFRHWTDFVSWADQANTFSAQQLSLLNSDKGVYDSGETAKIREPEGDHIVESQTEQLKELITLRESLYFIFSSIATGQDLPAPLWKQLNDQIKQAIWRAELAHTEDGYVWQVNMASPGWVVDHLLLNVEDLLRSSDLRRIRECDRCSWLFLNKGRGRGRRWCDMSTCGNRAKVESFRKK